MGLVQLTSSITNYASTDPSFLTGGLYRVLYVALLIAKFIFLLGFVYYGVQAVRARSVADALKGIGFLVLGAFTIKYGPDIIDFIVGSFF